MHRSVPTEPAAPYKLAHVVLRTAHLEESLSYYQRLLNARVVFDQRPFGAGLTYDEEHHRLALIAVPEDRPSEPGTVEGIQVVDAGGANLDGISFVARPGLEHLAFTFDSLASLLGTYVRVRDLGLLPSVCLNHGPTVSLYYEDPDGHKTELQIDTMPMELADEYLGTDTHSGNPIGWPFDPEDLLKRYEEGEPLHTLMSVGREDAPAFG